MIKALFSIVLFFCLLLFCSSCKEEKVKVDRFADKPKLASQEMQILDTIFLKKPNKNGDHYRISKEKALVYTVPNQLPVFPGCGKLSSLPARYSCSNQKLMQFVTKHIRYPEEAFKNSIEGTSVVSFVVDEKGRAINEKIEKSIGYGTDEIVLALIAKMRKNKVKWDPGFVKGKKVKVLQSLPVKFSLN